MKYSEKLRSPKWQKKKNRILERDGYTCRHCHSKDDTLVVHHLEYRGEPWDVSDEALITLCENCHDQIERLIKSIRKLSEHPEIVYALENAVEAINDPARSESMIAFLSLFKSKQNFRVVESLVDVFSGSNLWQTQNAIQHDEEVY